jgi:hypothetical protein
MRVSGDLVALRVGANDMVKISRTYQQGLLELNAEIGSEFRTMTFKHLAKPLKQVAKNKPKAAPLAIRGGAKRLASQIQMRRVTRKIIRAGKN